MFNQHIDMKLSYNTLIEVHGESPFTLNGQPLVSQSYGKRSLIDLLRKPRPQCVVNLETAADDPPGDLIFRPRRICFICRCNLLYHIFCFICFIIFLNLLNHATKKKTG